MRSSKVLIALLFAALAASPSAFGQESVEYKSDAAVQAFGSFVKDTVENGVQHQATHSGGVLGTYRYYFGRHHGAEVNYGYSLNSQRYSLGGITSGVKAYSHEASAAYVFRYPFQRFTPFALAGAGALMFDAKDFSSALQSRPAFVYGGGIDYNINSRWFIRAQYRGLVYESPTFEVSTVSAERVTHRAQPSAGIGFRF
jgi:opacity protein-like surface antigen